MTKSSEATSAKDIGPKIRESGRLDVTPAEPVETQTLTGELLVVAPRTRASTRQMRWLGLMRLWQRTPNREGLRIDSPSRRSYPSPNLLLFNRTLRGFHAPFRCNDGFPNFVRCFRIQCASPAISVAAAGRLRAAGSCHGETYLRRSLRPLSWNGWRRWPRPVS
jgi:hypothetical protein